MGSFLGKAKVNGSIGNALNVDNVVLYQPPSLGYEATTASPGKTPAGHVYTRGYCWEVMVPSTDWDSHSPEWTGT